MALYRLSRSTRAQSCRRGVTGNKDGCVEYSRLRPFVSARPEVSCLQKTDRRQVAEAVQVQPRRQNLRPLARQLSLCLRPSGTERRPKAAQKTGLKALWFQVYSCKQRKLFDCLGPLKRHCSLQHRAQQPNCTDRVCYHSFSHCAKGPATIK